MSGTLKVDLYCLCWNDARMLPFFFQHYDKFVDRYFVFDNGSTDNSLHLLLHHGRVQVERFQTDGDSFVDKERILGDTIWKGSLADWVIVTDIDEHIYHPELLNYLSSMKEQGVTAIQSIGYEMVADAFPSEARPLVELVTQGARSTGHDRLCIFNPRKIKETNFTPGRHRAKPEGNVVWPDYSQVLLLHYKHLGPEYIILRSGELRTGLKSRDIQNGWGMHYLWDSAEIRRNWQQLKSMSGPVPGLGTLSYIEPENYAQQERLLAKSGLIDNEWYSRQYPDILSTDFEPLLHFCIHGWKEGRRPNFYFDPAWYSQHYPDLSTEGNNPLFDYLTRGEEAEAWPSPHFNTPWYRKTHGLSQNQSPLTHYLKHRKERRVSPIPEFDVAAYCEEHENTLQPGDDPFEKSRLEQQRLEAQAEP
jgi:Glycosyl transferase family 2